MSSSLLFDHTLTSLHRGLNARQERQSIVAANVANVQSIHILMILSFSRFSHRLGWGRLEYVKPTD